MISVNPAEFLADQFPKKHWPLIPTTLRSAYQAADALVRDEPILQVPSAVYNKGRIVSFAVDLAFERLIQSGRLPFECRWKSYYRPTGKYLQIRLPQSNLSISQVADPDKQPRDVWFRRNARLNNQPALPFVEFVEEEAITGLPHFLLIHGYQELSFAHLAVPHPEHSRDYRYKTSNLLNLPHELPDEGPREEDTESMFDSIELLKEELERWKMDNGRE